MKLRKCLEADAIYELHMAQMRLGPPEGDIGLAIDALRASSGICELFALFALFLEPMFRDFEIKTSAQRTDVLLCSAIQTGIILLHAPICPYGGACMAKGLIDNELSSKAQKVWETSIKSFVREEIATAAVREANINTKVAIAAMTNQPTLHSLSIAAPLLITGNWKYLDPASKEALCRLLAVIGALHIESCQGRSAICCTYDVILSDL